MGIGRSAFYDTPDARARDLSIVAEMKTICDEFEAYGYRRVDAELIRSRIPGGRLPTAVTRRSTRLRAFWRLYDLSHFSTKPIQRSYPTGRRALAL